MCNVDDEERIARYYISKRDSSEKRGIPFELSLISVRNLLSAKHCYYTGVPLTKYNGKNRRGTDVTIDRVDSSKGYVKGNVVACSWMINQVKSLFENRGSPFGYKELKLFLKRTGGI